MIFLNFFISGDVFFEGFLEKIQKPQITMEQIDPIRVEVFCVDFLQ